MSKNSQINPNKNSLDSIKFPYDLRQLDVESLKHIAEEVRKEMIKSVSETGGHLGAGLGVVELSVALHLLSNAANVFINLILIHIHKNLTQFIKITLEEHKI